MLINPSSFDKAAVPADIAAINERILAFFKNAPDQWSFPPQMIRDARKKGAGVFPMEALSPGAQEILIPGPGGDVPLRVFRPEGAAKGVYLHIHGGGWVFGSADMQDERNERLARHCGLVVVSVEYRLAPEHPYPAGPDDCEAAALWLVREAPALFGTDRLLIGGESAGAHLSVVTMLRLRDKHRLLPFRAANLIAGCYDLAMTPSVRNWGKDKLILNTRDIFMFTHFFLRAGGDVRSADISPIHADLTGLPPALFTIGTRDPLLDDSLFMTARWSAAGNRCELDIWPGAPHVFTAFPCETTEKTLRRIDAFLNAA
jgi:acetyl esterase